VDADEPKAIGRLYTVRLSIEGMRHVIEQCLIDHDGALRATVEAELSKAVAGFDFAAAVRQEAVQVVRTVVRRSIERAVTGAFSDPTVTAFLLDTVSAHLRSLFDPKRGGVT
jgi:hypothetical protein